MDTIQTTLDRRSIRRYKRDPIPVGHLRQILESGRQAPSAANRQPWHFIVVGEPELRRQLAEACRSQTWMADAAYILVAVGHPGTSEKWYKVDVAIAVENMVLAARSLGYGTCWIGAFNPDEVKELCGVPPESEVVVCLALGVPDQSPAARSRKGWDEVFSANGYGEPLEI